MQEQIRVCMQADNPGLAVGQHNTTRQNVAHTTKLALFKRKQVSAVIMDPPAPCQFERGSAPRVPAPGVNRRVLQPQRLQAAVRGAVRFGQRLALQARQGGPELRCRGWRAGAAHVRRQVRQELLQLGIGRSGGLRSTTPHCLHV